ncbi:serine hydrolase [Streptomyces rimosus]|uniref:serine hydrolase n=1 Tax=Streptomyces rimosus TaxID=1927 RepID=UPI001F344E00|nr:serine hydrolase [Streptomyces rimosus]
MTIRQLCDAASRFSDGTAGNLLLHEIGGPGALTAFTRRLGDTITRMDRIEPAITEATPGDPRDTTSPRAFGMDYRKVVLGNVLAAVPREWTVAIKTGTGDYGILNDIAVVWPAKSAPPLLISIMSSKSTKDAAYDQALIADGAAYVMDTLG